NDITKKGLKWPFWCSRRDSNPYLQNRNLKFYPSNYGNGSAKRFKFSKSEAAAAKILLYHASRDQLWRIFNTFSPISGMSYDEKCENICNCVVLDAGHRYLNCSGNAAGSIAGFRLFYAVAGRFRSKLPFIN